MNLQETVAFVYDKANELSKANADQARPLAWLNTPREQFYEHNGKIESKPIPPSLRNHNVRTVADLIQAGKRWGKGGVIWLSSQFAMLAIDDNDRRESVTLALQKSVVFQKLEALEKGGVYDQASIIALLRREFRHSPEATTLLTAVRKIKFSLSTAGYSDVQHGNESLGRIIENEITGAENIAELITVPGSVYTNPGEDVAKFNVGLTLDLDAKNQKFLIRPLPDELEVAQQAALQSVRERLSKGLSDVPVFLGGM